MTMGMQMGYDEPHVFLSCAQVAAASLDDGQLWILVDPTTGNQVDAGIWPDTCRNGGGGDCAPGLVVFDPSGWIYLQPLQAAGGKPGPIVTQDDGGKFYVIDNATPPPP